MTQTIQESYTDIVQTLRDLGAALRPAVAAQFEAPPRARAVKESVTESKGIPNLTLDTVLDARRMALSEEIASTARTLRQASAMLGPHVLTLHTALARWEGHEGDLAS